MIFATGATVSVLVDGHVQLTILSGPLDRQDVIVPLWLVNWMEQQFHACQDSIQDRQLQARTFLQYKATEQALQPTAARLPDQAGGRPSELLSSQVSEGRVIPWTVPSA